MNISGISSGAPAYQPPPPSAVKTAPSEPATQPTATSSSDPDHDGDSDGKGLDVKA